MLTRPLLDRSQAELSDPRAWLRYALRRVLRIYPLFGFVLCVSWIGSMAQSEFFIPLDASALVEHLLLLRQGDPDAQPPPDSRVQRTPLLLQSAA